MKIFAIYIKVSLTKKPEWFGEFLEKYFEPVLLHVTLIQPRYINEDQIEDLKFAVVKALEKVSTGGADKKIFFDKLVIEKEFDGKYLFMMDARENNFISNLQKELLEVLKGYSTYVDDAAKEYENNFRPHITVAKDLDEPTKEEAEKYFVSDYVLEGLVESLVLPIVKDTSLEERTDLNNLTFYKL